jgi:hypothetical protein
MTQTPPLDLEDPNRDVRQLQATLDHVRGMVRERDAIIEGQDRDHKRLLDQIEQLQNRLTELSTCLHPQLDADGFCESCGVPGRVSAKDFDFDPRASRYYQGLNPLDPERVKRAINDGWTFVKEWSYEQDAHGYCHSRTDLIALLLEIRRLRELVTNGGEVSGDVVVGWRAAQNALRTDDPICAAVLESS